MGNLSTKLQQFSEHRLSLTTLVDKIRFLNYDQSYSGITEQWSDSQILEPYNFGERREWCPLPWGPP